VHLGSAARLDKAAACRNSITAQQVCLTSLQVLRHGLLELLLVLLGQGDCLSICLLLQSCLAPPIACPWLAMLAAACL
jgi:hypothetical protein